jgi:hypothetical protein
MAKKLKTGMRRTGNAQHVAELTMLLRAYGPTRRCLERATENYLLAVKARRPRTGMWSSQPPGHALQPPNREQRGTPQ